MQPEVSSPGAMSIAKFCAVYNIGRTKFYQELNAGRIAARKSGTRTLIERSEAERWLRSLPTINTSKAA
jgi:excisionase family DNA binding protein